MKNLIPFLCICLAAFLFACENTESSQSDKDQTELADEVTADGENAELTAEEEAEEGAEFPDPDATGNFGAEISAEGAVDGPALLAQLEGQDSIQVKFRGEISACCQAKGCWMTMPIEGEQELMVKFKDYAFFAPMNSTGKPAVVEGWAYKEIVSVDELRHYAEDNNASPEEIEAITEPEERITFMADGIIIEASAQGAEEE